MRAARPRPSTHAHAPRAGQLAPMGCAPPGHRTPRGRPWWRWTSAAEGCALSPARLCPSWTNPGRIRAASGPLPRARRDAAPLRTLTGDEGWKDARAQGCRSPSYYERGRGGKGARVRGSSAREARSGAWTNHGLRTIRPACPTECPTVSGSGGADVNPGPSTLHALYAPYAPLKEIDTPLKRTVERHHGRTPAP